MDLLELVELRPVLGEGAMGTMLQEHGLKIGDCPEAMNLDRPQVISGIHAAYRDAGCDFVKTNTFGANPLKLARYGLGGRLVEIVMAAVSLARDAAGDGCMVAGSVGPTGVLLEPYGDCPRPEVARAFRQTAEAMERAGVDFFLVETMSDPEEATLAIGAIRDVSERPVVATMAFTKGAKGFRTMMGTTPSAAASGLVAAGADLVGTNCCSGTDEACAIMSEMIGMTPRALVAQPNAGLPVVEGGRIVYPESPEAMREGMVGLLAEGVRILGGCCGTTPAHIREIAHLLGKC